MSKKEQALINEEVISMMNKYNVEVKQNVLHHVNACEPVKHTSTKHLVSMYCEATIQ